MEATLTTTTCARRSAFWKCSMSARTRSIACRGVSTTAAVRASARLWIRSPAATIVPGRSRASTSAKKSAAPSSSSGVIARLSVHIRRASSPRPPARMSWPPTTMSAKSTRSSRVNGSSAVTRPTGSMAPRRSAANPVIMVVATPPLAPMSHSPIRLSGIGSHILGRGGGCAGKPSPPFLFHSRGRQSRWSAAWCGPDSTDSIRPSSIRAIRSANE